MKDSALYIHIPFCDHKCIYCDFYSIITSDNITLFFNSLTKEIEYFSKLYSVDRKFSSIFFGGGTPSLMQPEYIADIINHLKKYFLVNTDAEITMETNPGTVDKAKLKRDYSSIYENCLKQGNCSVMLLVENDPNVTGEK